MQPVLNDATKAILTQKEEVQRLRTVADKHPFYKFNGVWSRELQNLVRLSNLFFTILRVECRLMNEQVQSIELCAYLGGLQEYKSSGSTSSFLTIDEVGWFLDSMLFLFVPSRGQDGAV